MKSQTESNVPNYPRGISRRNLIKRGLIAGIALSPASRLFAASGDQKGSNVQLSNLAYSVDTLSSPSQAQQVKGGQALLPRPSVQFELLTASVSRLVLSVLIERYSLFGRWSRAVGTGEPAAFAVGVPVNLVKSWL